MKCESLKPEVEVITNGYDQALEYLKEKLGEAENNFYSFVVKPLEDELLYSSNTYLNGWIAERIEYLVKNENEYIRRIKLEIERIENDYDLLVEDKSSYQITNIKE